MWHKRRMTYTVLDGYGYLYEPSTQALRMSERDKKGEEDGHGSERIQD
jgi:hypothetical protein